MIRLGRVTKEQIIDTISDPELFDRISEDGMSIDKYVHPDHLYIGCYDGGLLGFAAIHPENKTTAQIHVNFKKEFRGSAKEAVDLVFADLAKMGIEKLNCKIPVIYPDVIGFAKKMDMTQEGVDSFSIKKNGIMVDRIIMGIRLCPM